MEIKYNDKGHPFIVKDTYMKNGRRYACIEFINTGTIDHFRMDATNKGQIKDKYAKDILGKFCIGNVKKVDNNKEYSIWYHMLERCYRKDNKSYKNYGEKGVIVCNRWHCFEYFLNDLPLIDGYNEELFYNGLLELDKDVKQIGVVNKIYSLDTCKFVSRRENISNRDLREMRKIKAVGYKDGKEIFIDNIPKFAKEHNMSNSGIYECLNNIKETHNGWRFEKWKS